MYMLIQVLTRSIIIVKQYMLASTLNSAVANRRNISHKLLIVQPGQKKLNTSKYKKIHCCYNSLKY